MTDTLNDGVASGRLPLRITHNDTKINNILMGNESGKAVCVIDLDTVMPGLVINDYADAVRSGACTGCEDEKDLSKVELDLKLFEAFASGFFSEYRSIGRTELDMIPDACILMALECGMRFLTDYLQGDIYFKTDYEAQNLDRCRAQFRIAEDMERKKTDMRSIIQRISSQMSQSY
jgi:Ser/Thr protein kinase RdoA (MazF antagonist)